MCTLLASILMAILSAAAAAPSGWAPGAALAGPILGAAALAGPALGPAALSGPVVGPARVSGAIDGGAVVTGSIAGPSLVSGSVAPGTAVVGPALGWPAAAAHAPLLGLGWPGEYFDFEIHSFRHTLRNRQFTFIDASQLFIFFLSRHSSPMN